MTFHRFNALARLLLVLVLAGAALPSIQGARAAIPAPVVLADAGDAAALSWLESSGAQLLSDYGAFSLWRLSGLSSARLSGQPASLQPASQAIFLRDLQIQTGLEKAEPAVPLTLRQAPSQPGVPQFWMVQFVGPIRDEWLKELAAGGLESVAYLPDNAYVVWGVSPGSALNGLSALDDLLQWQGAYHPYYRLSPALRPDAQPAPSGDLDVTVQVYNTPGLKATLEELESMALQVLSPAGMVLNLTNVHLRLPASRLAEVAGLADVFNVEPYIRPVLNDEVQNQIMAGNIISAGGVTTPSGPGYLAWLASKGFPTTPASYPIVDVTDDGIDQGNASNVLHPDFHELGLLANPDRITYINDCTADATGNGVGGHGNLNLGIVGGYNNGAGAAYEDASGYQYGLGVSPYGRLAGTKVFANNGSWDYSQCGSSLSTLVANSYTSGARITNNSWGSNVDGEYTSESQEYDALTRDALAGSGGNQQMLHVFSSGNSGSGSNTTGSPGTAKNVLTVGAAENVRAEGVADGCTLSASNNAEDMAFYSSRGPTDDQRAKPDVVAPGSHITGPASQDPGYNGSGVCGMPSSSYYPLGQTLYTWSSGTSHSTPAVAGAAQLVYEYYGRVFAPGQTPSPAMLKALLLSSPRYMTGVGANDNLPGIGQGWGMLDLGMLFDSTPRLLVDQSTTFTNSGEVFTTSGSVGNNTRPLRVTLAWTDAPGATSGNAYVNDLDLEVIVGGNTYKGNVFSGASSTTGGAADPRNNVENVFLPAGVTGSFQVRVVAHNLAGDGVPGIGDATDQDFALVVYNSGALTEPVIYTSAMRWYEVNGNANGTIQPGEVWDLEVDLSNAQGAPTATALNAVLSSSSGSLQLVQNTSAYNDIPGAGTQANQVRYRLRVLESLGCNSAPLSLAVTYAQGSANVTLTPLTPAPIDTTTQSYTSTSTPVLILDRATVEVPLTIGEGGIISDVDANLTLTHSYDSDLVISLLSPGGTSSATLANRRGGGGDNYTNTTFDDEAASSISNGTPPFTGTFRPDSPLSAFDGLAAAGDWNLRVADVAGGDTGTVSAFNLTVTYAVCTPYAATYQNYLPMTVR